MRTPDYLKIYNLEDYLFNKVRPRFKKAGAVDPVDFYMIAIWKSPRAKGYAQKRLKKIGRGDCAEAVKEISKALWDNKRPKDRLKILMNDFGFRLATASAILTVLDPENFTVYDDRVCKQLKGFEKLSGRQFSEEFYEEYRRFVGAVKDAVLGQLSLRDKDRYLWGKSFYEGARNELKK